MPERYHIRTSPATPRFRPVGRLGIVDWREDCAGCHNCVKRACVYDLWRDEQDYVRSGPPDLDYIYQCKGCMNCVQDCTKGLLTRIVNPDYSHLGDEYYTPDVIQTTWWQAETGKIPVSGAGYRGPFAGSGFDAMWTDMSEIVRPTRDGIHGREYISTTVDIGRKLPYLRFDDGRLLSEAPPLIESPLPIVFDRLPAPWASERLYVAAANAAAKLGIRIVVAEEFLSEKFRNESTNILPAIVPLLTESKVQSASGGPESKVELIASAEMIEIHDRGGDTLAAVAKIKSLKPDLIVAIRVEASPLCAQRVAELAKGGAEVVHVAFDAHGRERIAPDNMQSRARQQAVSEEMQSRAREQAATGNSRHARTVLREVHKRLADLAIRDEITVIASGGIALAEHMAKAIICGADLVAINLPLVIALECRLCRRCESEEPCPVELQAVDVDWAGRRMTNLMSSWHLQLLEMMGAMGMREVRRLRGDTGRAMFRDDLEREIFAPLFQSRARK